VTTIHDQVGWIHVMLDLPPESAEPTTTFWADALGWPLGEPWPGHGEFASFTPPNGDAYVHRQLGDHGPRVHLDLEVENPAASTERLAALGADVGPAHPHWQVMSSPGGLPFCLVRMRPRERPGPLACGEGHRTRLAQVCIDSPAGRHEAEVAFWRAATGWRWVPGDAPEFAGKLYGASGSPIQLLFQRLGDDDSGTSTRAHVDLASNDIEADADRLVALGAEPIGPGHGWIALRDPAGLSFCTTGNPPD
jgi:hypothetical protein